MVQDQLVDYIKGQLKMGIGREAVKGALVAAGWVAADVEDTLKRVEAPVSVTPASASPVSSPVSVTAGPQPVVLNTPGVSASPAVKPAMSSVEPRSIRISDLVSSGPATPASAAASSTVKTPGSDPTKSPFFQNFTNNQPKKMDTTSSTTSQPVAASSAVMASPASGGSRLIMIALVVLMLIFAGGAGYLFYENSALSKQVTSLGGQSSGVTNQVAALDAQVKDLNASIKLLNEGNADLRTQLSFAALPVGASASSTAETVSVKGTVAQKGTAYILTTSFGVPVYVRNATDANLVAMLKPLIASASEVTLTGSHVPGSQYLTVESVNGASIKPVATTPTSTASTTTPAAASAPAAAPSTPPPSGPAPASSPDLQ